MVMNNKTTPSLQEPDELLPCPFCGYKAEMAESLCEAMYDICGDLSHPSQVCCPNCGCGAVGGRDVSDAITAWNTRNDTALQSEQANYKRLTDDEDIIEERDTWEEKATKLAELCGTLLNVDVGEHSNCNCPVDVAIEEVEIAINNNETINAN